MDTKQHWDDVYRKRAVDEVSWYRPHLDVSLQLIKSTGVNPQSRLIDVGGGASTLVDDLLAAGFLHLTVLDISQAAIEHAQARLGLAAAQVEWRVADVTAVTLPEHCFDLWHDRAVFHFLTQPEDRRTYISTVMHALKPGGHIIVASFGPDGPLKCSGLEVVRYHPEEMHREFGSSFQPVTNVSEEHLTLAGKPQAFTYCYCRLKGA